MANPLKKLLEKIAIYKEPLVNISGLYLGGNHYIRVISQPAGRPDFISDISGVATRFQLPSRYGNIGLIAHNYLSGKHFMELKQGDLIHVLDGFGHSNCYRVNSFRRLQALQPRSPHSDFIDLDSHELLSASGVFQQVYTGKHRVVLQTCIQKGDIREWGRFFVITEPVNGDHKRR